METYEDDAPWEEMITPLLSDVPRLQYPTIARVFFVAHARAERGLFRGPGYVCVSVSIRAF